LRTLSATQDQVRELKNKVNVCAKLSSVKKIAIDLEEFKSSINHELYKKTEVDQMIEQNMNQIASDYLTKSKFLKYTTDQSNVVDRCKSDINSNMLKIKEIESKESGLDAKIQENKKELTLKETIDECDKIRATFDSYCQYRHLKELYNQVMPEIENFNHHLQTFKGQIEEQRLIIRRFDEVMLSKASKFNLEQIETEFKKHLIVTEYDEYRQKVKKMDRCILHFLYADFMSMINKINKNIEKSNDEIHRTKDKLKQGIVVANQKLGSNFRTEMQLNLQKGILSRVSM